MRSEARRIATDDAPRAARSICPDETFARVRSAFPTLGITRVARVTGLDRIGIPVFMAVRPNARTLAVSQGKGIDDAAARASAVMEAAELATAEAFRTAGIETSRAELSDAAHPALDPACFVREGAHDVADAEVLPWVAGFDLIANRPAFVPRDVVALDFTAAGQQRHRFWQSSDGLASGNLLIEAVLHGLCERIERDANALWLLRSASFVARRCVHPESLREPVLAGMAERIAAAGLELRLFDMTSDIAVPAYFAVIGEPALRNNGGGKHFDLSAGSGCHPHAAWAALRAVTEAAQTRVTSISGARDDFDPARYHAPLATDLLAYLGCEPVRHPAPDPCAADAWTLLDRVLGALRAGGVGSAVAVPMGGESLGFAVAKVVVPELENPPGDRKRAFGSRALKVILGLA